MKYQLTELIKSLSKEELRNFKIYSSRFKYKGEEKKMITLFDWLKSETYDEYDISLPNLLFPNGSKNAYYQLKSRLAKEIENSLLLIHNSKGGEYSVYRFLQLSTIFKQKADYKKSYFFLQKAEKLAKHEGKNSLLNIIYFEMLDIYAKNPDGNLDKLRDKGLVNAERFVREFRYKIMLSSLKGKLYGTNFSSKSNPSIMTVFDETITALKMEDDLPFSIPLKIHMNESVRNVMLVRKEYVNLSEFLMIQYDEFKKEGIFKVEKEEEIKQLTWIINTLLRQRKIGQVNHYTDVLGKLLTSPENQHFKERYKWLLNQCRLISFTYSKRLDEAIALLENLEADKNKIPLFPIAVNLNLSVLHYYQGNMEDAFNYLAKILLDDDFKKLSVPLQMTVLVVELILRLENDDLFYAHNKYNSMRRKYRNYLMKDEYSRDKSFLNIIRDLIKEKKKKTDISSQLMQLINDFIDNSPPMEPGSNEIICYHIWLKGLLNSNPYYDLVIETLEE